MQISLSHLWKSKAGYLPVFVLFLISVVFALVTYQNYGISYDEPWQRVCGMMSYDYLSDENQKTFLKENDDPLLAMYGAGFELPLVVIEKWAHITKPRDIYLMRHLVTHIVFLLGCLSFAMLTFRLFGSRFLSCLCFAMLLLMPRIYAHSFFNTKDIPFLALICISIAVSQLAFSRERPHLFVLLGVVAGYTTSIRVMGIMLFCFILFFLAIYAIAARKERAKLVKTAGNTLLFIVSFCISLYAAWPYLWANPIHSFMECFRAMSKFQWDYSVLLLGKNERAVDLPWFYFPAWFSITIPALWLISGCAGIGTFLIHFAKNPQSFTGNTNKRIVLLSFLCFLAPAAAVLLLHSVIYDDWRHLYFIYPPFVLLALYFMSTIRTYKFYRLLQLTCCIQIAATGYFMINHIQFNQVFFNSFISHRPEYLRKNFELDYWGSSYKHALEYLLQLQPTGKIKVNAGPMWRPLRNNLLMLDDRDAERIEVTNHEHECDYFITNYRFHPDDYTYPNLLYAVKVHNSTVLCIYRMH